MLSNGNYKELQATCATARKHADQGNYEEAKRLKTLKGLTAVEFIAKAYAENPQRFRFHPYHLTSGPNN